MGCKNVIGAFMLMGAVFLSSTGNAATETYVFGNLYHPEDNAGYPDPASFASLSVVTGDTWTFRIEAYDLTTYFGENSFFGALATQSSDDKVEISGVNSSSGRVNVAYKKSGMIYQGSDSGGFTFDFSNTKQERLTDGGWVEWTVTGLSSILGYAAHIQGIDVGDINDGSAWYEAKPNPVPLPAAFWLVGSALLGLTVFKRYIKPKGQRAEGAMPSAETG